MNHMLEVLKIIVLGVVEGITEWLPISSTGHLILVDNFIKLAQSPQFIEVFLVIIQLGAILAVVALYFAKLNPFRHKIGSNEFRQTLKLWQKVLLASIPAAIIGFLFDNIIDKYLFNPVTVAVVLIIYGVAFLLIERRVWQPKVTSLDKLRPADVLKIGAFQVLALVPGTSRSGATILGGLISGVDRQVTTEFSFFMAIPVMFGASLLKLYKSGLGFTTSEWGLLALGVVVAFAVSIFAIKFLINYIKKNSFKVFGWYRIALGLLMLTIFCLLPLL